MKQRARCWFYATLAAVAATLAGCLVMTKDEGIRSVIYSVIGAVIGGTGMWGFEHRNVSFSPTPAPTVISSEGDQLRRLESHEKYIDEALRRVEKVELKQAVQNAESKDSGESMRRLETTEGHIQDLYKRSETLERKQAIHEVAKDAHKE